MSAKTQNNPNLAAAPAAAHPRTTRLSHLFSNQTTRPSWQPAWLALCLLLIVSLALVACGPEEGEGDAALTDQTIRIAQTYVESGDLGQARAQLETLDAANPTQFLIFLAEDRVKQDPGSPDTAALVHLALAMGLQSNPLMEYAQANGLLANTAPTPAPVAAGAQGMQPLTSAEQAATPAAVVVASTATIQLQPAPTNAPEPAAGDTATGGEAPAAPAAEVPAAAAPTAAPTETPISNPQVQASNPLNVRSGPGTAYPVVGALNTGQQADIVAKSPAGDWWQITLPDGVLGWVYGPLVQTRGDTSAIAVAANIPDAPPTPTPAPVAAAPTEAPPAEQPPAEAPPAEQPPAEPAPAEPAPAAPPADGGPDFVVIERRLWDVWETGGQVDAGGSVICGEKRELWVNVVDANGAQLNGVAVQAIYGNHEIYVTGDQGKGPGRVEFVLGEGQGVKVVRDTDGREVTSDIADGMTTRSPDIPDEILIGAKYCTDQASCDKFNYSAGCWGHHSWTVTFKRRY